MKTKDKTKNGTTTKKKIQTLKTKMITKKGTLK